MKSNWCTYFVMCQHLFDLSDQSVRHDILSVHVQVSYGTYDSSGLQTELIDD